MANRLMSVVACLRQLTRLAGKRYMQLVMEESGNLSLTSRSRWTLAILAGIPAGLFIALKQLHEPKHSFQFVSIVSQSPEEPAATMAEMARTQATLIRRAHIEMIALTLLVLALLYFLFSRNLVPKQMKYLLVASAAASLAACWLQW